MKEVSEQTFKILVTIFDNKPIRILESCNLYHFYFNNKNGMTTCSYTKDDIIKLYEGSK